MTRSEKDSLKLLEFLQLERDIRQDKTDPSWLITDNLDYGVAVLFVILGGTAILFNALILTILIQQHRQVFEHVFYLLIINFTIVDILKGASLIMWEARTFVSPEGSIVIVKVEQMALLLLRFCNLTTILNILLLTLNEFIFIVYSIRYRILITKKRVVFMILLCWILSWTFTIIGALFKSSQTAVMVIANCRPSTRNEAQLNKTTAFDETTQRTNCIVRTSNSTINWSHVFLFSLIAFCTCCFLVAIICYTVLFRVISRIVKQDLQVFTEIAQECPGNVRPSLSASAAENASRMMRRHKYVLVIGSVLFIYTVYLISYSAIQLLQFVRLIDYKVLGRKTRLVRWMFLTFIGLHSIVQPLCYFRMREFRKLIFKSFGQICGNQRMTGTMISQTENLPGTSRLKTGCIRVSLDMAMVPKVYNEQRGRRGRSSLIVHKFEGPVTEEAV